MPASAPFSAPAGSLARRVVPQAATMRARKNQQRDMPCLPVEDCRRRPCSGVSARQRGPRTPRRASGAGNSPPRRCRSNDAGIRSNREPSSIRAGSSKDHSRGTIARSARQPDGRCSRCSPVPRGPSQAILRRVRRLESKGSIAWQALHCTVSLSLLRPWVALRRSKSGRPAVRSVALIRAVS